MSLLNHIRDVLTEVAKDKTVIVCIGNTLKSDDGAAIVLYEKIVGKIHAELINAATVPESYIRRITKLAPSTVVLVDSVDFEGLDGQIKAFTTEQIPEVAFSTHVMSLRLFTDMLERETQAKIIFIGIQPQTLKLGTGLSGSVKSAVNELSELLIAIFGDNSIS
jgi:hydrogenase 3 maturation protease